MIKQTHPHQHPKKHPQKHQLKQKRRSRTFFPESAKEEFKVPEGLALPSARKIRKECFRKESVSNSGGE